MRFDVKRWALVGLVAMWVPLIARSQSALAPISGETAVSSLPGTQTFPSLAVGSNGGYIVWEDNAIDRIGLGIGMRRISADLLPVGDAVRVNVQTFGDQEKPQVALLKEGSALVVWQGDKKGLDSDIFMRVISPSGTFSGGEIRVNQTTANQQRSPVIAALTDGTAVIAWSSYAQDGSMDGVFARRFDAKGKPIGNEFQVSVTTPFNQRAPSIAGIPNGNFVVSWVSEWTGGVKANVNVVARLFDASANPLSGEISVNDNTNSVCSNPSVAATSDNGFTVAYAKNMGPYFENRVVNGETRRVMRSPNDFDIFSRRFSAAGQPSSAEQRVNSQTFGDQYAPKILSIGASQFVVWTSMGRDGSRETVVGRVLLFDGAPAGEDFVINTTSLNQQFQPAVGSDGNGRYLVVWSGFTTGPNGFDLFGQRYEATILQATLKPLTDALELSWSSQPGKNYKVQSSTDFLNWTDLPGTYRANDARHAIQIQGAQSSAFYRVVQVQ